MTTTGTVFEARDQLERADRDKKFTYHAANDGEFYIIARSHTQPEDGVLCKEINGYEVRIMVTGNK